MGHCKIMSFCLPLYYFFQELGWHSDDLAIVCLEFFKALQINGVYFAFKINLQREVNGTISAIHNLPVKITSGWLFLFVERNRATY